MRLALVVLVVAAAVVPTAVISSPTTERSSASRPWRGYSVQQVLSVFKQEGIPLERDTVDEASASYEQFEQQSFGNNFNLGVTVYQRGAYPPKKQAIVVFGSQFPTLSHRKNVWVSWTASAREARKSTAVRAALRLLRYSRLDAARPQLPTFLLHPGDWRTLTIRQAPNGSEMECQNGSVPSGKYSDPVIASIIISAGTRQLATFTSQTSSGYTGTPTPSRTARLSWVPLHGGSVLHFSCSSRTH